MDSDMRAALDRRDQLKEELYKMMQEHKSKEMVEEKFKKFKEAHKNLLEVCKTRDKQELIKEIKNAA